MPKEHRKNKPRTDKASEATGSLTQNELIQDAVRTELEAQQANRLSEVMESIRDVVRKEVGASQSRKQSADAYAQRVREADTNVTEFIQQAIKETTRASRVAVILYVVSYIAAFLAVISGTALAFNQGETTRFFILALILIGGGAAWIISLQRNSPVKNSRQMVNHMAKLNIIFAGNIRQMHQMDAVFESLCSSEKEIDLVTAGQMLSHLQDISMEGTSVLSQVANDADES